jgi:hypothetical protein
MSATIAGLRPDNMEQKYEHQRKLSEIATELQAGGDSPIVTVRLFLSWFFGSKRRGTWIVPYIRSCLHEARLSTLPDFESAYLNATMQFQLLAPSSIQSDLSPDVVETVTVTDHAEVRVTNTIFADPTYRVSKLAAANNKPIVVRPDSTLTETVTALLANDFSQLPVMTNERDVKGVISWASPRAAGIRWWIRGGVENPPFAKRVWRMLAANLFTDLSGRGWPQFQTTLTLNSVSRVR